MNRKEFAKNLRTLAGKFNAVSQQDQDFRNRAIQLASEVEEACDRQPIKWAVPLDIHGMGNTNSK
jgi:hypothetical protein